MAAPKRKGLGRGLEALLGEVEIEPTQISEQDDAQEPAETGADTKAGRGRKASGTGKAVQADENSVVFLDINEIRPNENQPRRKFDEEKIAELADSILEHGLIQPIVVRRKEKGYEIVAGERRYRAVRRAALKTIPCIVRELTDEQNMLLAIIENMQREDLNPIEEAQAIEKMISTYGLTQEQVSKSLSKSRPYITNALRLLKLPERVRQMVVDGALSQGHARALVAVNDEKKQILLAERAVAEGLSVREIEKLSGEGRRTGKAPKRAGKKSVEIGVIEEELKGILGTRVNLIEKGKRGKIEIEYYSRDELERLLELLQSLKQ